jgi:D-proline reductase (dithiol) PrdB
MTKFAFYPQDVANRFEQYAAEYAFEQTEPTPWTPLHGALRDLKATLVTTGGIRLKTQREYLADRHHGSTEWREISMYAESDAFAFDFTNYDPAEAERDINVIAPIDRLKELVDAGQLAGVGETFFSFFGLCPKLDALKESAAAVAERMRAHDVGVAFVFPANLVCNQTAAIVSRELERAGVSTVTLSTIKEVTAQIRVPRPLFINFPFGRTLGRAGDAELQRQIVGDMVRVLKTHDRPGRMVDLSYVWQGILE